MVWQPNSQGRSRNVRTVMADTTVLAVTDGLFMKHSAHLGIHTELRIPHRDLLTSAARHATLRLKASPLSRDPPWKCEEANPAPRLRDPVPSGERQYFTFYCLALSWNFPALWTLSLCISCISLTYIAVCTHRPHGFLKCRVFNSFFLRCQCLNACNRVAEPCTQHSVSLPASVRWKVPSSSLLHLKVALWHDFHMPWMCVTRSRERRSLPAPASLPSRTEQGRESPWPQLPSPREGVIETLHNFSLTIYSLTATRI